ncbi:hypothetical protein GGH92_007519, partial [Coemansia sp. RSA 2673]
MAMTLEEKMRQANAHRQRRHRRYYAPTFILISDLTAIMHSRPQNAHASAWRQRARQKGGLTNNKVPCYHQQGARHEYVGLQVFKADRNRYPFQDKYYDRSLNKVAFQRSLLELLNNRSRFLAPVYCLFMTETPRCKP